MRKYLFTIFVLIFFCGNISFGQFARKADSLSALIKNAPTDAEKVKASGQLAELFYVYQLDNAGDSMLQRQLRIAEMSGDKKLILAALFDEAINNLSSWRSTEAFNKAISYAQKGLDYARSASLEDYVALAYSRLSAQYRKRGQIDNAFYNANNGFTTASNIENDSIKIITALELGDVYRLKGELLFAYKMYSNAQNRAIDMGYPALLSETYHHYSDLYFLLKNNEEAIQYLMQSLELNKKNNNPDGLFKDYNDLARITDERTYIDKALETAQSLGLDKYIIQAKRVLFGYYTFVIGNSDSTLDYINRNPDLKEAYLNEGTAKFNRKLGQVFLYSRKYDSAIYYFQKAEPVFERLYDPQIRQSLYEDIGKCFEWKGQGRKAIPYYEKAMALLNQFNDLNRTARYAGSLSKLYVQQGDYKKAYLYAMQKTSVADSLGKLANQREIAMAEVTNEKRLQEKEKEAAVRYSIRKRNLGYMAITFLITVIFFTMIVLGMFHLSKLTIRLLGFFAFISLFEFIVLLIDSWLHKIAHGAPLKIWLMKIVLIAILVPLQSSLEHAMTNFIASRKLHKVRHAIKKWGKRNKKNRIAPSDAGENNPPATG